MDCGRRGVSPFCFLPGPPTKGIREHFQQLAGEWGSDEADEESASYAAAALPLTVRKKPPSTHLTCM